MEQIYEKLNDIAHTQVLQEGLNATLIPSVNIFKSSNISQKLQTVYEPSLFVIVQGEKVVIIDDKTIQYNPSSYLISSIFMPVSGQIIKAPFLSFQITFNFKDIFDAIKNFSITPQKNMKTKLAISSYSMDSSLLDSIYRLVALLQTPQDIDGLSSLYLQEILYRLLISNNHHELKQFAYVEGNAYKISQAINYINENIFESIAIEELAEHIKMGVSSFYKHFKTITAMSPLQYIKKQKLQKAKNLMLTDNMDISGASFYVGYKSISQFSREYSNYFGINPSSDIKNFKQQWYQ